MRIPNRLSSGLLAGSALAALLFAQTPAARAADKIRVGQAAQAFSFAVPEIGTEAGIFQRLGVDCEKIEFSGAAKENQGLIANAADVGLTGSTDFAFEVKGAPHRTVAAIVVYPVNMALSVVNAIKSPDDLKGKRIGVTQSGTLTYWMALEFARTKGWGKDGVIPVPVGGVLANQVAALVTGQVEAVMSDAAVGLTLAQQGRGRLLMTAQDFVPNFAANSIIAHTDFIRDHPDVLKRFLKGWFESVTWLLAHKEESVKIGMKVTGLSKPVMDAEYDEQRQMWSRDGRFSQQQLDQLARAITEIGLVEQKPDLTKFYDPSFLP